MPDNDPDKESFEETLRAIAEELGRKLESSIDSFDSDKIAESFGVDPTLARDWVARVRRSLRTLGPMFGAGRMLEDYEKKVYTA